MSHKPFVVKWILERGYHKDKSTITHLSLSKGSYNIPYSATHEFHKACAVSIERNEPISLVEVKGDTFVFFVDIDYKAKLPLEDNEIRSLTGGIHESVKRVLGNPEQGKCVVCTSKAKQIEPHSGFKTGVHLIFPDIVVDQFLASMLAKQIVVDLEGAFGPRQEQSWSDVIDPSVYKHKKTGLRMKYCCKPDEPTRVYKPVYMHGHDCDLATWDLPELLSLCSIRTDKTDKTFVLREQIEETLLHQEEEAQIAQQTGLTGLQEVSAIHASTLQDFIRIIYPQHKITSLRKVCKVEKKDKYIIFVDSKYCLNMNREHKSNNVYFVATKDGVSQKCFCNCKTKEHRMHGFCKDFSSPFFNLSPNVKKILFGCAKKKSMKKDDMAGADECGNEFLDSLLCK
jgi:hypothetical protein